MHTVFALLCFVVVIHWLIFPYPSGLLHRHCGNLTIAPVPAKQPWWIWIDTSCEFIINDCIATTKQSTTKPCAYFLGYTVYKMMPITLDIQRSWSLENTPLVSVGSSDLGRIYMMTSSNGNIFRVTGHSCEEFTGDRWILQTMASNAELWWYTLGSAPEQTVESTIVRLAIWDALEPIMRQL